MAKIRISRPTSTGTALYGSQRKHHNFVTISINVGGSGDHCLEKSKDDTGFKGAHASTLKRIEHMYDKTRPSMSVRDERDEATGLYATGAYLGYRLVDAPELSDVDRRSEVIEVSMSFEQFAEMLVSTGHEIDCTVTALKPIGTPGEVYEEEVTPPAQIGNRAARRLANVQENTLAEINAGLADIDAWKATEKIKDAARARLHNIRTHIVSNAAFVVTQASEEMAAVAEGAVSIIADKVAGLEAAGRLPAGTLARFCDGGAMNLLTGGAEPEIPSGQVADQG